MAFNIANLVIGFSGAGRAGAGAAREYHGSDDHPTIWAYNAGADAIASIEGGGYFADPLPLRAGDLIMVTASDGKALYRVEIMPGNAVADMYLIKLANVNSFGSVSTFLAT
jgi:hypothetical protein